MELSFRVDPTPHQPLPISSAPSGRELVVFSVVNLIIIIREQFIAVYACIDGFCSAGTRDCLVRHDFIFIERVYVHKQNTQHAIFLVCLREIFEGVSEHVVDVGLLGKCGYPPDKSCHRVRARIRVEMFTSAKYSTEDKITLGYEKDFAHSTSCILKYAVHSLMMRYFFMCGSMWFNELALRLTRLETMKMIHMKWRGCRW